MKHRFCLWLAAWAALLVSAPLFAAGWSSVSSLQPTWITSGPKNSMFAADAGAFYGSATAGKSWQTMAGPSGGPYSALTYFDGVVWMGTTQKGAAYSKTLGLSWSASNSGMLNPFTNVANQINALVAQPHVPNNLVAGNSAGVYLSTDGGGTWNSSAKGLPTQTVGSLTYPHAVLSLATATGGAILAGTGAGVYRSLDGGANWTASGLTTGKVTQVSSLWSGVYAIVESAGLYVSTDGGNNWSLSTAFSGVVPVAVLAHPERPGVVFVGTSKGAVHQSDDYGASWYEISDGSFSGSSVRALAVPAEQPDALVVSTTAGMFRYESLVIPAAIDVPLDTNISSSEVVVSGLLQAATITVSGGLYSINGGAYTSQPGVVANGTRLRVQVRSSTAFSTSTTATIRIGAVPARFLATTIRPSAVSSLTEVFVVSPAGAQIVNGVVQVSSTTPVILQPNPPAGSVIQTTTGTRLVSGTMLITDHSSGTGASFSGINGAGLTFVSSGSGTVPQVVNGTYLIESATPGNKISVGPGGEVATVSAVASMSVDRTAALTSVYVGSGTASISYDNAFADSMTIYAGETAEVGVEGSLSRIRLGSLNGDQGLPGDPITLADVATDEKLPKLAGNLARLNNSASLLNVIQAGLNEKFGVSNGLVSYDQARGVVVYSVNGRSHRFLPVGSPTVQLGGTVTAAPNRFSAVSVASSIAGTFSVVSQGIELTLASSLAYFTDLSQAIKTMDANAKVRVRSNGVLQLTIGGADYVAIPGSIGAGGTATPSVAPGFQLDNNGLIAFMDSYGAMQVLYPVFADTSVVDLTIKAIDPAGSASDNGNGTGTMLLLGATYTTHPEYQLIPLPAAHASDQWWLDGTRIFVRYPDGTAQAFSL